MSRKLAHRERPEPGGQVEVLIQLPLLNPSVAAYFRATPAASDAAWTRLPEIPTSQEIRSSGHEPGAQVLTPNVRRGPWADRETYLASQYAFLREEAVRPLREAVSQVKIIPMADEENFQKGSIGIYEKVHIIGWLASTRGIAIRITFSTRRAGKKILWQQAKRLLTGSLVALSPSSDMFQSKVILATVAARPLDGLNQNPPELDLFFARSEELEIDPAIPWTMIEARNAFFEAERHTMLAVQKLAVEPFPLSKHIVGVNGDIPPPRHVLDSPQKDITTIFGDDPKYKQANVLTAWPTVSDIDLDDSQQQAVQRIFTKSLAIIQGPPGTGKTFVSVKAVRALLANMDDDAPPIIVTAQTNHALDQLLRHIAEFESNFVRLGGRSKDKEIVFARTLYNIRQGEQERLPGCSAPRARKEMQRLETIMKELMEPLFRSQVALDTRILLKHDILTAKQVAFLEEGASKWQHADAKSSASIRVFELWAKQSMIPVAYKPQNEDFGFAYEEEELEPEDLLDIEAENAVKDDDFVDSLKGNTYTIADNFTCRVVAGAKASAVKKMLDKTDDLWTTPEGHRGAIYRYLQDQLKQALLRGFRKLVEQHTVASRDFRVGQWEKDELILRKQRVIGCTVTGLSKYRGLIAALRPKIVLLEEAAELLEAPVLAACMPSLEQLILVGDHLQLRGHCRVREHEQKPLRYDISLFERMFDNDMGRTVLTRQRRMLPEIRRLLRPIYGDIITDHPYVKDKTNRPDVVGMGGINSFFFSHEWIESHDESHSCINQDEADFMVGFATHLVRNGMESRHITMLTFYNGQRKRLLKLMRQSTVLCKNSCPVVTVDSYQGEENKVVLLSCVRSNANGSIGFLSNDNRLCVALSRAQEGFYIFGNGWILKNHKTWKRVFKIMGGHDTKELPDLEPKRIHTRFPVRCVNHEEQVWLETPADWTVLSGGCHRACEYVHNCGHTCTLTCHPYDHALAGCSIACEKVLDCGHVCSKACGQRCACALCPEKGRTTSELQSPRGSPVVLSDSITWHDFAKHEHARYTKACQTPPELDLSPAKKSSSPSKEELLIEI